MQVRTIGVGAVLLLFGAGAAAGDVRPTDELKMLAGSWSCEGMGRSAAGAPAAFRARFTNKWDLAGTWLAVRYEQTPPKGPALATQGFLGWDGSDRRFVFMAADSDGGWVRASGAGWSGESLELVGEGNLDGKRLPLRFTFTRGRSERDLLFAVERQEGTRWSLMTQDSCKR